MKSSRQNRESEVNCPASTRPTLDQRLFEEYSKITIHPHPGSAEDYSSLIMAQYFNRWHGSDPDPAAKNESQNFDSNVTKMQAKSNNSNNKREVISQDEYSQRLDAIDPKTAGRLDLNRIKQEAEHQVKWAFEIIDLLFDPNKLVHASEEQEREKIAKKGAPKAEFVNTKYRKMFDRLTEIGMMEYLKPGDERLEEGREVNMVASAVMFMVEKLGTECKIQRGGVEVVVMLLRIITDARRANAKLMNNLTYNIFTLDVLFQIYSNVYHRAQRGGKKIYCINADLRHWFYQIPIPEHLRNLFQFRFKNGDVFRSKLLAMGWCCSPPIAQAITWTLVLSAARGKKVPGLSRLELLKQMPPWLAFDKDEGGIFVLQDNIFIVTDNKQLADAWSSHLSERAKHFNAEFKNAGPVVIEISEENNSSVEFNGIDFFYDRWRTANRQERSEEFNGPEPYRFVHRKISRLLGEDLDC